MDSDDNLVCLADAISRILLKDIYSRVNGIHNLWGLVASADPYLHLYSAPFVCPATRPACYDPAINMEASCLDQVCTKTAWAALIQDYEAYKAAERGVKVFIEAVVNKTWICKLCDPETFYSNVTALIIFDHLCKHFGSLHALDMVLLIIQISQYYDGMPDIPEYIFLPPRHLCPQHLCWHCRWHHCMLLRQRPIQAQEPPTICPSMPRHAIIHQNPGQHCPPLGRQSNCHLHQA
jgi:hypothetical protein